MEQISINTATDFLSGAKAVNQTTNPDSYYYLTRMRELCREIQIRPDRYINQLAKVLIGIYADTGDYSTVQAASDSQWISFIENNILNAFESVASVLAIEKTEYDSLP